MNTNALRGMLMVLLAAMLWGTTGTAQSLAPGGLSAYWVGALRLVIASLFFAAVAMPLSRGSALAVPAAALPWRGMVAAGLCMAVYNLAFFAGVRASGVAVGTAVAIGSGPLWAGLLQFIAHRRAPARGWWAGTLLAITGGVLLTTGDSGASMPLSPFGIMLCLLAGLSYAAYALVNKQLVSRAPATSVTLWVFTIAGALAAPIAWIVSGAPLLRPADLWVVGYLGLVATGVAYLLFSHALRHISGATGVTLALAEPVTAFVLAVLIVGERPSMLAFAGIALVMSGVAVVVRAELKASPLAA